LFILVQVRSTLAHEGPASIVGGAVTIACHSCLAARVAVVADSAPTRADVHPIPHTAVVAGACLCAGMAAIIPNTDCCSRGRCGTAARTVAAIVCCSAIQASGSSRHKCRTGATATSFTGCTGNTIIIRIATSITTTRWSPAYTISVRTSRTIKCCATTRTGT